MSETTVETGAQTTGEGAGGGDASIVLTEHEILALLTFAQSESADISRGIFRLDGLKDNELMRHAGMTTLIVRRFAHVEGDGVVLEEPIATIAAILLNAREWFEIGLVTPHGDHVVFGVGAPGGAFMVNLDRVGTHRFYPSEQGAGLAEGALRVARHYLETAPDGLPAAASVTRHVLGESPRSANLKADPDGTFALATGLGENPPIRAVPASSAFDEFAAAFTA